MVKKSLISLLIFTFITGFNLQICFAQTKNDWNRVVSQINNIVAVKIASGQTIFGKLTNANDTEIILQVAHKKELTSQSRTFNRNEVKKVWLAELNANKVGKSVAIGAGIGAGVGAGAGAGLLGATGGSDETGAVIAATIAIGAGVGALVGLLVGGKGNKKRELLYEN